MMTIIRIAVPTAGANAASLSLGAGVRFGPVLAKKSDVVTPLVPLKRLEDKDMTDIWLTFG
jgi:hypothetical protein